MMKHLRRFSRLAALAVLACTASLHAQFTVFEATGANPAAITPTRDAFRTAIGGGTVAGANGSFGGVRREINWDGVPDSFADGNALPANFFNVNSPRGVVFSTPGTGFLVSSNAGQPAPVLFGFSGDFQTFSPQRLFTAISSNVTDVNFFLPGSNVAAATTAFGVIFTDVEVAGLTHLDFFDQNNNLIFTRDALVGGNQSLSFVGAIATGGELISRVRITSGLNTIVSNGVLGNPNDDVVVMDDFIFAEAVAVPEPSTIALTGLGLAAVIGFTVRKKRRRKARVAGKSALPSFVSPA
ncbi:MAG: PEP-CTERM sorting domain-containing protein [Gemmatales bacterium]